MENIQLKSKKEAAALVKLIIDVRAMVASERTTAESERPTVENARATKSVRATREDATKQAII
jgi:hypothetical protein